MTPLTCLLEIMHRLPTALPSVRQNLLQFIIPWLYNMELVDYSLPMSSPLDSLRSIKDPRQEFLKPPLKGSGWGSPEATNMILNNLFYTTLMVR